MCGGRKIRDNFVSSSQFCCGPKTVPKNKFYFLKSTLKTISTYYMVYPDDGILCVWVTQPCLTVCDPMNCSPPGSSVHGILQARILEWIAMPFSRGSSQPRDWTHIYCFACGFFTDTCYNMENTWHHYARRNKPITKGHVLYDFIYEMSRISKYIETESRLVVA